MARTGKCVVVLVMVVAVLLMSADGFAQESWSKVFKTFKQATASGTVNDKIAAVDKVANFDNKKAIKTLSDYYAKVQKKLSNARDLARVSNDVKIQEAIVSSMAEKCRSEEAQKEILKLLTQKSWEKQALAGKLIGEAKMEKHLSTIHKNMGKITDGRALMEIFYSLTIFAKKSSIVPIGEAMGRTQAWNTKEAAIEAFLVIGDMSAAPYIFEIFKDKTSSVRLLERAHHALVSLTGQNFHRNYNMWKSWYDKNKSTIDKGSFKKGEKFYNDSEQNSSGTYYGIPLNSDKIVFIIDRSGSMADPYKPAGGPGGVTSGQGGGKKNRVGVGSTKMEVAINELVAAIKDLRPNVKFTVIAFSTNFTVWKGKMQSATKTSKDAAMRWVKGLTAQGSTNIYDPVEKAIQIANGGKGAGVGAVTTKGGFIGALVDTIFLLSDGSPNAGKVPKPNDVLVAVRNLNKKLKITIHTIGIGPHNTSFMRSMADQNNGEYVTR